MYATYPSQHERHAYDIKTLLLVFLRCSDTECSPSHLYLVAFGEQICVSRARLLIQFSYIFSLIVISSFFFRRKTFSSFIYGTLPFESRVFRQACCWKRIQKRNNKCHFWPLFTTFWRTSTTFKNFIMPTLPTNFHRMPVIKKFELPSTEWRERIRSNLKRKDRWGHKKKSQFPRTTKTKKFYKRTRKFLKIKNFQPTFT